MRASRVRCFLLSVGLGHYVAQVSSNAAGTKITNTGTNMYGGPVDIGARPLRPSASEGPRRRLPRAQVFSAAGADITVSDPGKASVHVRDPRPLRPPARKRRNETQAMGGSGLTFTCYGEDVTAPNSMTTVCDGS